MGKPGDPQHVSKMFQSPFMDHSAVHGDGEHYARAASESRHGEVIPRDIRGTKCKDKCYRTRGFPAIHGSGKYLSVCEVGMWYIWL